MREHEGAPERAWGSRERADGRNGRSRGSKSNDAKSRGGRKFKRHFREKSVPADARLGRLKLAARGLAPRAQLGIEFRIPPI
jgi:hypothetical protein